MANEEMYEPDIISVNDEDGNEILLNFLKDMKQTMMYMLLSRNTVMTMRTLLRLILR